MVVRKDAWSAKKDRHPAGGGLLEICAGPGNYLTPFLERRVPAVAPWRALNLGLLLQITYSVPLRFTIWQSAWRRFIEAKEERTFMVYNSGLVFGSGDGIYRLVKNCKVISLPKVRCGLLGDAFVRNMPWAWMALNSGPAEQF